MKTIYFKHARKNEMKPLREYLRQHPEDINAVYIEGSGIVGRGAANIVYYGKKAAAFGWIGGVFLVASTGGAAAAAAPVAISLGEAIGAVIGLCGLGASFYVPFVAGDEALTHMTYINGRTLLHFAALGNAIQVAQFLIEQGARTDLTDLKGKTFLDIARDAGHKDFVSAAKASMDARAGQLAQQNNSILNLQETLSAEQKQNLLLQKKLDAEEQQHLELEQKYVKALSELNKVTPAHSSSQTPGNPFQNHHAAGAVSSQVFENN